MYIKCTFDYNTLNTMYVMCVPLCDNRRVLHGTSRYILSRNYEHLINTCTFHSRFAHKLTLTQLTFMYIHVYTWCVSIFEITYNTFTVCKCLNNNRNAALCLTIILLSIYFVCIFEYKCVVHITNYTNSVL